MPANVDSRRQFRRGIGWLATLAVVSGLIVSPTSVANATEAVVGADDTVSVGMGRQHSCAALSTGAAVCWGFNYYGQLGNGTRSDSATPVQVTGLATGVTDVVGGGDFSCALLTTGAVKCWGKNGYGQLGNSSTSDSTTPVQVTGLTSGVTQISAGKDSACARLVGGTIKCWGTNNLGQAGIGTTTPWLLSEPQQVLSITTAVSVSVGIQHACALLADQTVQCWGDNWDGQLGRGTISVNWPDLFSPQPVISLGGPVAQLSSGGYHTCVVLTTGDVQCWGDNGYGQVGDNNAYYSVIASPRTVAGLTGVSSVRAGQVHTCSRLTSGNVVCWGNNWFGSLGNGSNVDSWQPVNVGLSGATSTALFVGNDQACVIVTSGNVVCWGSNSNSQAPGIVPDYPISTAPAPSISGDVAVGHTVTATPGTWAPTPTSFDYQWMRGGVDIPGATGVTYVVQAADYNQSLSVRVTSSRVHFQSTTRTSNAGTNVASGSFTTIGTPVISGTSRVGSTLTASTGVWSPTAESFTYVWSSSSTADGTFVAIPGATTSSLDLPASQVGKFVRVTVSAVKSGYSTTSAHSATTSSVSAAAWATSATPSISGTLQVGQTLSATAGTWSPTPSTFSYSWASASTASGPFSPLEGATSSTYTLTAADLGRFLRVTVSPTLAGYESTSRDSAVTSAVAGATFTATPAPSIVGDLTVGQTLTANLGTWSPVPSSYEYQWMRSASVGGTCTAIAGETGSTYVATVADVGSYLCLTVTGRRDGFVSASVAGSLNSVIKGTFVAPVPSLPARIRVGESVTAGNVNWSPTPDDMNFEWLLDGEPQNGINGNAFTPSSDDLGKTLTVSVRGQRTNYHDAVKTSAGVTIERGDFESTPRPSITGKPRVGDTLTASSLPWIPVVSTLTYQWFSAPSAVGPYTAIEGANSSSYTLLPQDALAFLRVRATGSAPGYNDAHVDSEASDAVVGVFSRLTDGSITGSARVGATLTVDPGQWSPAAQSYAYEWSTGEAASGPFTKIPHATTESLSIDSAHIGKYLRVIVTALRTGYDSASHTLTMADAVSSAFATTPVPTVSGTMAVGKTLTVSVSNWSPTPTVVAVQWMRNGNEIAGATDESYTLMPTDLGAVITAQVACSRPFYDTTTVQNVSEVTVAAGTFDLTAQPTISGTLGAGKTLRARPGTWIPAWNNVTYSWMSSVNANGPFAPIDGATSETFVPTDAEIGRYLVVEVTGTRSGFTPETVRSAPTDIVQASFTRAPAPTISGLAQVGQVLTATTRSWVPLADLTYQWLADGVEIPGQTSNQLTITSRLENTRISVRVTGSQTGFVTLSRTSATTDTVVLAPIPRTQVPLVSGVAQVGRQLTAITGTWSARTEFTYQWIRASSPTEEYTLIRGATGATYTPNATDRGDWLGVVVTGTRDGNAPTTRISSFVGVVAPGQFDGVAAPRIVGNLIPGSVISVQLASLTPTPATTTFEWQISSSATGTFRTITAATANAYKVKTADRGKYVKVIVTSTRPGYSKLTLMSDVVRITP